MATCLHRNGADRSHVSWMAAQNIMLTLASTDIGPSVDPTGSQPGDVLTLSGAGVARAAAGCVVRGHHHFTLVPVVPSGEQLGQRGVGLVRRLAALQGAGGSAGETSGSEADSES